MTSTTDYILGTNDEEIARLGVQHRAWLPSARAAWQCAGITQGKVVFDVGCGPGYASLDLAKLVGPSGKVIAIDKSERFLSALEAECRAQRIENITTRRVDLDDYDFARNKGDAAWCRWVFAFLTRPREIASRLAAGISSGGSLVVHEYFDYATWRTSPRCPELERFVRAVMRSWREAGGEPNIALSLPGWFDDLGFEMRSVRPIVERVQAGDPKWRWLRSFIEVGRRRLVDLGYLSAPDSDSIWQAFRKIENVPGTRMISPAVLEIIAQKRGPG